MAARKGKATTKAKKSAAKPSRPNAKLVATFASGDDIRPRVVAIMASVCGTSSDKVGALCLSDLASPCNLILRGRTASELNSEWPTLMPPFKPTDVACADTADTLSHRVRQQLP